MMMMSRFQQLQELLIVTPFNLDVCFRKDGDAIIHEETFVVGDTTVERQASEAQNTLIQSIRDYYDYICHFVQGLQGDEVIAARVVHLPRLELMEELYHQSLPDAVLVDAPAFHMLEKITEANAGEVPEALRGLFKYSFPFDASALEMTRRIRQWSVMEGFRTVILNLSHDDVEEDRIQFLVQGADELLDSSMSSDELCIRVLSHIRRHLDHYQSPLTRQPNLSLLARMFARRVRFTETQLSPETVVHSAEKASGKVGHWSMAVFYVSSLEVYASLYGEDSKVRLLQHVASLLGQMLHVPDWVFHVEENLFVVLSTPERVERIMPIMMKRLGSSCEHFISEADQERGFFIIKNERLSSRVPMLRIGAGVLSTYTTQFKNLNAVLSKGLYLAHKALNQLQDGEASTWLTDKRLIAGGVSTEEFDAAANPEAQEQAAPFAVVVEPDAALAFLLQQTISMNGIDVEVMPSIDEALEAIKRRMPLAIVVDPFLSAKEEQGPGQNPWAPLKTLKAAAPYAYILATCNHDDDEEALIHGADAYLPKPYQLLPLLSWLDEVIKSRLD